MPGKLDVLVHLLLQTFGGLRMCSKGFFFISLTAPLPTKASMSTNFVKASSSEVTFFSSQLPALNLHSQYWLQNEKIYLLSPKFAKVFAWCNDWTLTGAMFSFVVPFPIQSIVFGGPWILVENGSLGGGTTTVGGVGWPPKAVANGFVSENPFDPKDGVLWAWCIEGAIDIWGGDWCPQASKGEEAKLPRSVGQSWVCWSVLGTAGATPNGPVADVRMWDWFPDRFEILSPVPVELVVVLKLSANGSPNGDAPKASKLVGTVESCWTPCSICCSSDSKSSKSATTTPPSLDF